MYVCMYEQLLFFTSEIKILQLRQTSFMYNTYVYIICNILQFNIITVIFVKDGNKIYLLVGSWCQKFEMMTLAQPLTF